MNLTKKSEYEKRLAQIQGMFAQFADHATEQALMRCPYKDRRDQCTAQFGCRNQRKPKVDGQLPMCASNDKLDYRSAWETEPDSYVPLRLTLQHRNWKAQGNGSPQMMTSVSYGNTHVPATVGKTIFAHADDLSVQVPTSCGRTGHCHECIVEIKHGMEALGPRTEAEAFLRDHYRLACQAVITKSTHDIEFALLRRSPKILTAQSRRKVDLDPMVTHQGQSVCYDGEVTDEYRGHIYGIAVDMGTTTVVAELVDLETGQLHYQTSFENPQRFGGSDVMHRISYDVGAFRGELHRAIINTLNSEIRQMCTGLGISRHQIYEIVVVGNSTMRDLFFGLDVQPIGEKPYKSTIESQYLDGQRHTTSLNVSVRKLGLYANKQARVFGAPLIASHVGADAAAGLLAIDMASRHEPVMLIDVGTNTEIVIGHKDRLIAASCPAGPAFEGGLVTFGMSGSEGAIESVRYEGQSGRAHRFKYKTIGDVEPQGICGSGLIDLLAELRRHGLMTPKGVFADKAKQFTIVPEQSVTFSRQDASHLAQAKGANYCGQIILMRHFGVTPQQISSLFLAGGFANYINPDNAVDIGFLAPVPAQRIVKVGNTAAQGAREMLLSRQRRNTLDQLAQSVEHVELETTPDFFDLFVEGCQFKPMKFPNTTEP